MIQHILAYGSGWSDLVLHTTCNGVCVIDSSTDEGATGPSNSSGPESEREHLSQETRGPNQVQ